jgi:hypothetical protein
LGNGILDCATHLTVFDSILFRLLFFSLFLLSSTSLTIVPFTFHVGVKVMSGEPTHQNSLTLSLDLAYKEESRPLTWWPPYFLGGVY